MYQIDLQFNQVNSDSQGFTGGESRCIKSVRFRSFFGPYSAVFGINAKRPEKLRTRILVTQSHCLFAISLFVCCESYYLDDFFKN